MTKVKDGESASSVHLLHSEEQPTFFFFFKLILQIWF